MRFDQNKPINNIGVLNLSVNRQITLDDVVSKALRVAAPVTYTRFWLSARVRNSTQPPVFPRHLYSRSRRHLLRRSRSSLSSLPSGGSLKFRVALI
ncbi:hypothetical protein K1719_012213 [Acacia pycnantha]|nr:hypothetical protein K1719_012213 [Acacia pycnantha]